MDDLQRDSLRLERYDHQDGRDACLITFDMIRSLLPNRSDDSHKGSYGKALFIGGSGRFAGAALLGTAACLRTGAGITYAAVPASIRREFFCLPEAICLSCGDGERWDPGACLDAIDHLRGKTSVAVGPGMGTIEDESLLAAILRSGIPSVIDADGLNHIAGHRELLHLLHDRVVITPHPGEMARLTGLDVETVLASPSWTASAFSREYGCVVLLKGAVSFIAQNGRLFRNETGDSSLSKGGSGDMLTGIILALLAQGIDPIGSACAGSYLLGASGRNAESLLEKRMLLGRDVIGMIRETMEGLRL